MWHLLPGWGPAHAWGPLLVSAAMENLRAPVGKGGDSSVGGAVPGLRMMGWLRDPSPAPSDMGQLRQGSQSGPLSLVAHP